MSDRPLLDTLADMTAASLERADLTDREVMLVRLGALAAVGAPTSSYLLNLGAAADMGLTLEDAQSVLITVAPIIGGPKALASAGSIFKALGFAIAALEDEAEAEADDDE
jgi:hypothetical protein